MYSETIHTTETITITSCIDILQFRYLCIGIKYEAYLHSYFIKIRGLKISALNTNVLIRLMRNLLFQIHFE